MSTISEIFINSLPTIACALVVASLFYQIKQTLRFREAKRLTAAMLSGNRSFTSLVTLPQDGGRLEIASYSEAEVLIREASSRLHLVYAVALASALDRPSKKIVIREIAVISKLLHSAQPKVLEIKSFENEILLTLGRKP